MLLFYYDLFSKQLGKFSILLKFDAFDPKKPLAFISHNLLN